LNAARDATFFLGTLPWVAAALGGYFVLGTITVRRPAGRLGLVAIWLLVVVVFALAGRPEPIQPYPG
jgi:hypothetical protein